MSIDWDQIYAGRGLYSGLGSRGSCAELKSRVIRQLIDRLKPKSILDVGCGDLHVIGTVDLTGIDYTGVDRSDVLVMGLRSQGKSQRICHGDFMDLDFNRKYDLVICMDLLIHLDDPNSYKLFAQKLLAVTGDALLVSGYSRDTEDISHSAVVYFHEPLVRTFATSEMEVFGEYRETTLALIRPPKGQARKPRIWSYWETPAGASRPQYLDLCEDTWKAHCGNDFEIIRVTPDNVDDFAPELIDEWHRLPVLAHKADYLRAVLVYRHGGIWLDSDIIVLQNLRTMWEKLEESGSDFIGCGRPGKRPSNGVFGGLASSVLLAKYIDAMNQHIRSRRGDLAFRWTEIGYDLLWPLTKGYDFFQYDFRVCIPIPPSRKETFFKSVPLDELDSADCDLRDDTLTVYLYNAIFPTWFKQLSSQDILDSDIVIGQFFRRALAISDP
jgi:SAM-dependent methyltransferase